MKKAKLIVVSAACVSLLLSQVALANSEPQEFKACMKQTEHARALCQAGCGMILLQCYDEANDALAAKIEAIIRKPRSAACTSLVTSYAESSSQLASSVSAEASIQPGWLGLDIKMNFEQHRLDTLMLLDDECK